jgi:hypothetical protein
MVNATVNNKGVSITLSDGQSTTVPSNETWKVTITCEPRSGGGTVSVSIDGTTIAEANSSSNRSYGDSYGYASVSSTVPFDTVLVGGETVSASGGGVRISGFVVNQ